MPHSPSGAAADAWRAVPPFPELREGAVHVWMAPLNVPDGLRRSFWNTLSPDERSRAARFRFDRLQARYVAAHGILRDILSRYLTAAPAAVVFGAGHYGKPFVVGDATLPEVQFNLSHAGDLAVIAVAQDRRVGVDVESIRPIPELASIVDHYFSPGEQSLMHGSTEAAEKGRAFMVCWTRKEAYIKAVGKGLSIPLPSFDTSIPPGAAGRSLKSNDEPAAIRGWWVSDLPFIPDCAGALVSDGPAGEYHYLRWSAEADAEAQPQKT